MYSSLVPARDMPTLDDGVYRYYDVSSVGERFVYRLVGRFRIDGTTVTVLDDRAGLLTRYLATGEITRTKLRFLSSLLSGSYAYVALEYPGVSYLLP